MSSTRHHDHILRMSTQMHPLSNGACSLAVQLRIVDFEVKQMDKIPLWYKQQTDILRCFEESHGSAL